MKTKHIIIGLIILLVVLFFIQKKEHAGSTTSPNLSNEAIQNIAKIYADTSNTATFNNIRVTDKITGNVAGNLTGNVAGNLTGNVAGNVAGNLTGNVTSPNGKYKLSISDTGMLQLLDENNQNINIRGKYTGRFYSPTGDYYIKVRNASERGIFVGYKTAGDVLQGVVINSINSENDDPVNDPKGIS
jgi:hypothetical protein